MPVREANALVQKAVVLLRNEHFQQRAGGIAINPSPNQSTSSINMSGFSVSTRFRAWIILPESALKLLQRQKEKEQKVPCTQHRSPMAFK